MKHIKLFESFVSEKMGVPDGLSAAADKVTDAAIDAIQNDNNEITCETDGPGYPKGTINVKISGKTEIDGPSGVNGAMHPKTFIIDEDGTYKVGISVEILRSILQDLAGEKMDMRVELRRTIYHEMLHVYETYLRRTTGAIDMTELDTFIYDKISGALRNQNIPQPLAKFFAFVYLAQAFEVSARVPEAYVLIRNIPDPHKRLDILKKSSMWIHAQYMIDFDAEEVIDQMKEEAGPQWIPFKKQLAEVMGTMLSQASDKTGQFLKLTFNMNPEERKKAKELVPSKRNRAAMKNASTDIEKMMHEWEGIINRAGAKLKQKLSKLTTI